MKITINFNEYGNAYFEGMDNREITSWALQQASRNVREGKLSIQDGNGNTVAYISLEEV